MSGWELFGAGSASGWMTVLGLGLLGAFLALDDTALLQSWVSQPLPAGTLAGIVGGDPVSGLTLGLLAQMLVLGNIPVGQTFPGEHVAAVVGGVGAICLAGRQLPADPLALSPMASLTGWLLLAVALCSLAGRWVVSFERKAHLAWMLQGHRSLRDGSLGRFERIHLRCLASTAGRGFLLVLLWLVVILNAWLPLHDRLPLWIRDGLSHLPMLVPALAVGLLMDRYGPRVCWPYLLAGAALTLLVLKILG